MIEIRIPKIGVEDGEVVLTGWEKEEGAQIEKNEIIATVETEKVNSDILAPATGILKIKLQPGETANMTDTIGYIVPAIAKEKQNEIKDFHLVSPQNENPKVVTSHTSYEHLSPSARRKKMSLPIIQFKSDKTKRIIGSPAAKRIARELGINFETVNGTGPNGAILSKDVFETRKNQQVQIVETIPEIEKEIVLEEKTVYSREKLSPIRKAIARNMSESLQHSAQMTLMGTISLDKIWPFFQQMKEDLLAHSLKPSWAAIFIKVAALALEEHRHLNGTVEGDELIIWNNINIGVAVSTKKGLVVPTIKDANTKSLLLIHKELIEVAENARTNKLKMDDLSKSTFTLTNVGSYGGEFGTPILNRKELGILGIGAVTKQPIVNENDEIVVGRCCAYNLTVDHQMIDGEAAGLFIKSIKRIFNSPTLLLMR
ncbi:dihydrolipoamide acetyltransferase family protein [Neobacillus niacini]|uniref:dihydrolipoamide acetyltransferase family protein n=1 Tax=Neobacillus niacini TaxID=86668 RepID=UPI002FFF0BCF